MKYNKYWADMHSNIHHEKIEQLPMWIERAREVMDFWPIAYYPFYMKPTKWGLDVEDKYPDDVSNRDWEYIRTLTKEQNEVGFPMFMGYEWQGNGTDGDHNVFFLENDNTQEHPMTYQELYEAYKNVEAIAIPHHVAYSLGSRGKNWSTHIESFSPFCELYSSHGCSENDIGPLKMTRHVHMGPRTTNTCYEEGLNRGYKVGCICSGDNHGLPGIFEHGTMCALATDKSKEAIWDALKHSRVYGVSQSRIELDFNINDKVMGETLKLEEGEEAELKFKVKGTAAIDRIEILKNNILDEMVVKSGTWERKEFNDDELIKFKFRVEFGWGCDTRVYPDITNRSWKCKLDCNGGKLLSIEKCWNTYGQNLYNVKEDSCEFDLTTYKTTATGKWMGPSNVTSEGFIFEVEAKPSQDLYLTVEGKLYKLNVKEFLKGSQVFVLMDEAKELTKRVFGDVEHYRDDPWYHNAYKFKVHKFDPEESYNVDFSKQIKLDEKANYRLRVWQKNGDVAWSSPIYVEKK